MSSRFMALAQQSIVWGNKIHLSPRFSVGEMLNLTERQPTRNRFSVAIPASLVSDTPHLREKTAKLGLIARACAIFGVREIILYPDDAHLDQGNDLKFCEVILNFIETPQYLRKSLFQLSPALRFTGVLPPLQTLHHDVPRSVEDCKIGDVREGAVIGRRGGKLIVDVGLKRSLECLGGLSVGTRVTVRLTGLATSFIGEIIDESKISIYWGYRVSHRKFRLGSLLEKEKFDLTIGTSRYGMQLRNVWSEVSRKLKEMGSVLVVFGSPRMGLREILSQDGKRPEDVFDFLINTVPDQNVATVRSEEAVLTSLAVFNAMRSV